MPFHLTGTAAAGVHGGGRARGQPGGGRPDRVHTGLDANVYAIALATGKLRWEHVV